MRWRSTCVRPACAQRPGRPGCTSRHSHGLSVVRGAWCVVCGKFNFCFLELSGVIFLNIFNLQLVKSLVQHPQIRRDNYTWYTCVCTHLYAHLCLHTCVACLCTCVHVWGVGEHLGECLYVYTE